MTKQEEDPRIVKLQEALAKEISAEIFHIRNSISKTIIPRGGRVLINIIGWDETIETDSGLNMSVDYAPDQHARREGDQPTNQTLNGTIIETSALAEEEGYRVGMNVIVIKPEVGMGYSTKITLPSKNGEEVFTLYIMHYGDILGIVAEEHKSNK